MSSTPVRLATLSQETDQDAVQDLDQWAFAFETDGFDAAASLGQLEWERTVGAYLPDPAGTGERLAGLHSTHGFEVPVPGGTVRAGGLTWVGVHPSFRRRGILTAMMRHQLDDVHGRGEPVSLLWAAEPAIYGRFGYGLATRGVELTVPRGAAMRDVPGSEDLLVDFEHVDPARHAELVRRVHLAAGADRPGWVRRSSPGLTAWALADQPAMRRGAETLRIALVRSAGGEVRGYALFRRVMDWKQTGPNGTVRVREAVALDAAAHRALWGRLTDLDLMGTLTTGPQAVDGPLLHLLVDLRAAAPQLGDALWVRLVDLPAALAARRYSAPLDVVLGVSDAFLPRNAGSWRLAGGLDGATCVPAGDGPDAEPDLLLDTRELAAAWLGGESLQAMAAAGLVTERRAGALEEAARAFGWHVAPYCPWVF